MTEERTNLCFFMGRGRTPLLPARAPMMALGGRGRVLGTLPLTLTMVFPFVVLAGRGSSLSLFFPRGVLVLTAVGGGCGAVNEPLGGTVKVALKGGALRG